ncbi:hypothetical protein BpHYR1_054576 [Brachionus plicatilis]|uniref:Uncharacterized protein n=1 Tax=Brachionus plicatilis TaxID=10195 RepID=A0A3M7R7G3_BRAPC|nr:hypothetical protein BpHYR1_054576 [Brachionus plicatilis]
MDLKKLNLGEELLAAQKTQQFLFFIFKQILDAIYIESSLRKKQLFNCRPKYYSLLMNAIRLCEGNIGLKIRLRIIDALALI